VATFPATRRLKTPDEFRRVYERKRSVADAGFVMYACENDRAYSRIGLSVSRKVGHAVVRNRVKRCLREAFRTTQHLWPVGIDFIIVARAGVASPVVAELQQSLPDLAAQAARRLRGGRA
jgi:ribonuclease P protein component